MGDGGLGGGAAIGGGFQTGGGAATGGGVATGGGDNNTVTGGGAATGGGTGTGGGAATGGGSGTGGGTVTGGGTATGGGAPSGGGGSNVNLDQPLTPGDPGTVDVRLDVKSNVGRHPISPLIYGTNQPVNPSTNRYGLLRMGGNRLTAFNWENNASNAGNDYQFQNDDYLVMSQPAASRKNTGLAVQMRLDAAKTINAAAMVTVPILDYVAADQNGGGDVRNSGANYLTTRFKQNKATKGLPFTTTPDPNDPFVYQDEFIAWLRGRASGVNVIVSLDNEPDLWNDTHAEIHPNKVTYAELTTRTLAYARAVKAVWPQVPVTGFVSYGWNGYVNLQNATDAANRDFINYFLDTVRDASNADGHRLIDYLDLHWYPEAHPQGNNNRIIGTDTSAAMVAARVQAPRSLWDPTYNEISWVQSYVGGPIRLIPLLKEKIVAHDPSMKLGFTEWSYGGGGHISGAVATADVLGIFGREDIGLATFWKLSGTPEPFVDAAFAAFRNYDGFGSAFGDTSLGATSSAIATASIYASVDAPNKARTVLVVINRDTTARTAGITVAHPTAYSRLRVYVLAGTSSTIGTAPDVLATATNAFRYTMPPLSVSILLPVP